MLGLLLSEFSQEIMSAQYGPTRHVYYLLFNHGSKAYICISSFWHFLKEY